MRDGKQGILTILEKHLVIVEDEQVGLRPPRHEVLMDLSQLLVRMEVGVTQQLMVLAQHGMQMVVEPILMQMVPLVLILQMVRVPILMPMEIHTAQMPMAIVPLQEQMAHPAP